MKAILTLILTGCLIIVGIAEMNYHIALQVTMQTELTDEDICESMEMYGFDMASDPHKEITLSQKVKAIFRKQPIQ